MNEQWQGFLQQQGATIENGVVTDFANSQLDFKNINQTTVLVDLSHRGLIKATGEDAEAFLQGQFCNDIKAVDNNHSQLSAYCTPKGRILASFRLFQTADGYFLNMHHDVIAATLKRLRMFVLRSQVVLDDVSDEIVQIGIAGPQAETLLAQQFNTVPSDANAVSQQGALICVRLAGQTPRFEIQGPVDDMQALWSHLSASSVPAASHYWSWLDIQAGLPTVSGPVVEAFVPQMINLHWIDGLSFKKGCYPGQEIVARTHYLGKLKRRMYLAHINTATCPASGDEVQRLSAPEGQAAGKILLSHPAPQGGCDVLVVMQIDAVNADEIIANRDSEAKLDFQDLPYAVDGAA